MLAGLSGGDKLVAQSRGGSLRSVSRAALRGGRRSMLGPTLGGSRADVRLPPIEQDTRPLAGAQRGRVACACRRVDQGLAARLVCGARGLRLLEQAVKRALGLHRIGRRRGTRALPQRPRDVVRDIAIGRMAPPVDAAIIR